MQRTDIWRTALCVSQRCTLRCKLCLAFIPYYENPKDLSLAETKDVLKSYFSVVDTVKTFTVTGGEPLMNKELAEILKVVYSYKSQITESVDFVTNATLDIPEDILQIFERNADITRLVLSDYGDLSPKIQSISEELGKRNITYRISNFHGDDLYFDGWIDFTDHSKKIDDLELRDAQGRECIHRSGRYFVINDGELHSCSRSYWRMGQETIPRIKGEYIDLTSSSITIEEKRKDLSHMFSQASSTSCGYCVGLRNNVKRHYPAEQLPIK
ncbi:radical SAM family protein [Kineothrix alysoides]|uniref:Radical SAM family protein n=1 Tax=Kineothrix alysoides TaxID=1469948 RepID=A0A4R1R200_9FIRM|nr:radical SAM protein [Kineothrix alysoides]TCL59371.1 radical SAM family protein [Kineothrix alysoides]